MAKAAGASLAEASSHSVPPDVFLRHYRTIRDLKDEHASTGTALARAKKAAKGDGIDLDALKMLEKLADLDTDEAELQIKHLQIYAGWLKLPIGTQLNMWGKPEAATVDAKAAEEQREWEAGSNGYKAGEAGHERETNPHEAGSAEYVAWDKSWVRGHKVWLNGQTAIAREMKPNGAKANGTANGHTAPRRRGRPPKSSGAEATVQ
jgi:hypothetical protein